MTVSLIMDGFLLVVSDSVVLTGGGGGGGGGGAPSDTASANSAPSFAAPLAFRCTPSAMSVATFICGHRSTRVTRLRAFTIAGSAALKSRMAWFPAVQSRLNGGMVDTMTRGAEDAARITSKSDPSLAGAFGMSMRPDASFVPIRRRTTSGGFSASLPEIGMFLSWSIV